MRRTSLCAVILLLVVGVELRATENVHLSMTSSPADPETLTVGDLFTIYVQLSGLPPGYELDYLSAVIGYDNTLFSTPTVSKGETVSDPLDFISAVYANSPAEVSATYLPSDSAHNVKSNGTFFSFSTKPLKAGPGSFSFNYADGSSPSGDINVTGASLSVRAVNTPEPSTVVLLATAALAAFAYYLQRKSIAFSRS